MSTKNPTAVLLEKFYASFVKGDWAAALAECPEQITFQVAGKSQLAGKFTKATFVQGYASKLQEISGGTYQLEVHDILVSDRHATVLASTRVTRDGKATELRGVHVWRIEGGKPVAWYEYPRDLYQFDTVWA
jgi:ketosteroid isomerase-like protein